jgi:transposase
MSSVTLERGVLHLGLDVHKDTITVGVLPAGAEGVAIDRICSDPESVRRLIGRFPDRSLLRVCYEAGPTGYGLARQLWSMGVSCEVIAPSLVPVAVGDRVKTDKRDARRLARLHRAGELTAISVPTPSQEAVRDLSRSRLDLMTDRGRTRRRLLALCLRHGIIYRDGQNWTVKHRKWLGSVSFPEPATTATFGHYLSGIDVQDAQLAALDNDLVHWRTEPEFAEPTNRLAAYRGVAELTALTLVSEVGDWRRFASAPQFMSYLGMVPSEHSSGLTQHRGHLTKAGSSELRRLLIEAGWHYRHLPAVGVQLASRQRRVEAATIARSWKAQQRLCGRFHRLSNRINTRSVVVTAVARELAGFLWAEMIA